MVQSLTETLIQLGKIGDKPGDSPEDRLRHRLLVYMACLMAVGGLVWGSLAVYFNSNGPALVPYGYVVFTIANLSYLRATKNFPLVRRVQVGLSLLLPFLFQWFLGGFAASGGMMLWALLAIVGTHAFGAWKSSLAWGLGFIALTLVSGVIDADMASRFTRTTNPGVRTAFFVVNITMISAIMFSLTSWLLVQREVLTQKLKHTGAKITRLNESLEETVTLRTARLKTTMTELEGANERLLPLAKAWEQVGDPIEICDRNGRVIFVNPAFEQLSEAGATEAAGKRSQIISENPTLLDRLQAGQPANATRSAPRTETGQTREYEVTLSPVIDSENTLSRIVIIHRDITERLQTERDLMQQDRLASLGTLAAGMAHEINNPLTYIQANLQQMQETILAPPGDTPPDLQDLGVLGAECLTGLDRVAEIVSTLLQAARPDHSTTGPVAVQPLIESCLRVVEHELPHKAQLELSLPPTPVYVDGNEAKLSQVVLNLILNALAAMESTRADSNRLSIRARSESDVVHLEVSDTGTGIAPENLDKLFNPFFTTKPVGEGVGLGLAMSHRIITNMGGTIVPTSEVGLGSTFLLALPASAPPKPAMAPQPPSATAPFGRILVIDDLPEIARVLARFLRKHDVTIAQTTDEALMQLQNNDFDVVLSDIMMPGMTGLQLHAAIQASRPELAQRFIFVTGGVFSEVDLESAHASRCPIVRKPVVRQELLTAVHSVMKTGPLVTPS